MARGLCKGNILDVWQTLRWIGIFYLASMRGELKERILFNGCLLRYIMNWLCQYLIFRQTFLLLWNYGTQEVDQAIGGPIPEMCWDDIWALFWHETGNAGFRYLQEESISQFFIRGFYDSFTETARPIDRRIIELTGDFLSLELTEKILFMRI